MKTGALIVIEQKVALGEYERTGIAVDGIVSSQLLINIFEHNTPLHDGAVIIRGSRIVSATCYLPLTDSMELGKELGTRHRAAVGISEVSDSTTVVVSEETGAVSVAREGQLYRTWDREALRERLNLLRPDPAGSIDVLKKWKGLLRSERPEKFKKSKNLKSNNTGMKILSVFIAILIWLLVANINDPVRTERFSGIPVQIINENALTSLGYAYEVLEGDEVSITVEGKRSVLNDMSASDFSGGGGFLQSSRGGCGSHRRERKKNMPISWKSPWVMSIP